jgi:hypothetical protein
VIDWDRIYRGQPTTADIKKAIKKAKNLPDAGDHGHVQAMFPIYNKLLPPIPQGSWDDAKLKTVKFSKLQATNQQLDRQNLQWHLAHPGQSRFRGPRNTHPQLLKTKSGTYAIVDGHHRLSALQMLGIDREQCWVLKEDDL